MRTTVDIDDPILKELKRLGKKEGKSLGRLISDLLAQALRRHKKSEQRPEQPIWISRNMRARVNLDDKEVLYAALDDRTTPDTKTDKP